MNTDQSLQTFVSACQEYLNTGEASEETKVILEGMIALAADQETANDLCELLENLKRAASKWGISPLSFLIVLIEADILKISSKILRRAWEKEMLTGLVNILSRNQIAQSF